MTPSTVARQRIRVLRVIARMNVGGPALQVAGLCDDLDPARFEQRLVTGTVGPEEADYLELRAPHITAVRAPGLGRSVRAWGDIRALQAIRAEIRSFHPRIVHTHTAKAGVLGRLAAATAGVPATVHTFHGHLLHGYFSPAVTRVVVATERFLARRTSRLVAVGQQVRDELLAAGIGTPDQFMVVPPGVQLPNAPERPVARTSLELPSDAPVVAFVARLTRVKRPDRFLNVANRISQRRPDTLFLVVGEGSELSEMQRMAARSPARVRFLGWRSDVETVYAASDLTILTSDNEGMPVSLIEAAMSGCPAVTTDVGSASEVVIDGQTGFVRHPDPHALAEAALAIIENPDLARRMSADAQERARSHFSRRRLVEDMARIYEGLAEEKGFACVSL